MLKDTAGNLGDLGERATLWLARLGAVCLTILMMLTFFDVVGRSMKQPILGAVEMTSLLMGLIIFLGIGLTTVTGGHISVDILVTYLPRRIKAGLEVVTISISIFFASLMCWQLWRKASDTFDTGDTTQIWEVPVWPVVYVMAFCSITIITGLAFHLVRAISTVVRGETDS